MEFQLLLIAAKLIDICTIQTFTDNRLIIIERGDAVKETLTETVWKFYTLSVERTKFALTNQFSVFIPHGSEISAATINGKIYAVRQSNFNDALFLFVVPEGEKGTHAVPVSPQLLKVNISIESGLKINLPANGDWSTPFLSTRRCLFNQNILPFGSTATLITANTADATTWVLAVDKETVVEKKSFSNCAEPRLIETKGNRLLFFRHSPANWPLFYNLPDTRMGPELLPLWLHRINDDFAIEETDSSLSKGLVTGPSFVFDACSNNHGDLILATVTGLINRPILQILISSNNGKSWYERAIVPLKNVPHRLRVTTSNTHILTACTFKEHDGYHVMAAEIPVDEPKKH